MRDGGSALCFVSGCGGSVCHSSDEEPRRFKGQEKRTPSRPWPPCEPRGYAVAKGAWGKVRRQSAAGQFVKKEQLSALQIAVGADRNARQFTQLKPELIELLLTRISSALRRKSTATPH